MNSETLFFLNTCNLGLATRKVLNPFTNQEFSEPIDEGLSDSESAELLKLFAIYNVTGPYDGGHLIGPVYGSEAASFHPGNEIGGPLPVISISTFITGEVTEGVVAMIYTMAKNVNLALLSGLRRNVRIVGRQPNSTELARWPDAKALFTVDELREWLLELE